MKHRMHVAGASGRARLGVGFLAVGLFGLVAGCGEEWEPRRVMPPEVVYGTLTERTPGEPLSATEERTLVEGQTAFALELYREVTARHPGENVALGPYSVWQALAMIYAGANGATADEIRATMHYDLAEPRFHEAAGVLDLDLLSRDRQSGITLSIANQAWAQQGLALRDPYLDTLTGAYGAPLAVEDFAGDPEAARATINDWVAAMTDDEIRELFPAGSITTQTIVVLANAMYLDARWKFPFPVERTTDAPFHLPDGSTVDVPTMHYDEYLPTAIGTDWQAVEIPYAGEELSMVVIVPDDLASFEAGLDRDRLADILGRISDGGIHLSLPRFTFSFDRSLVDPLRALGMSTVFDAADLSRMIDGGSGLAVGTVEHEAFVEVNEAGTRAAAATGGAGPVSHGPFIQVDRPFLFLIRDEPTGAPLFLGRVLDPRAN